MGNSFLSSLTRFSHKLSLYLECLAAILLPTRGASRGIVQCSFMSLIQNDPQNLAETFLRRLLQSKWCTSEGLQQESLREKTNNTCISACQCQLSLLQIQLPLAVSVWLLDPASHVPSTPLASLHKRKASTKCPFLILWSGSTLHQSFRFSSLLITFNLTQ